MNEKRVETKNGCIVGVEEGLPGLAEGYLPIHNGVFGLLIPTYMYIGMRGTAAYMEASGLGLIGNKTCRVV